MGETLSLFTTSFNRSLAVEARPERLSRDAGAVLLRYLVRKAGRWWVQRDEAVGFLRRRGRDPLGACHRPYRIWMPYHLTA